MENALTLDSQVVASKHQVSSQLGEEAVILDLKAGVYHGLNVTSARIWQLVQQTSSVAAIRDCILAEYDVEPRRCEQDVLAILREFKDKGLIDVTEGRPQFAHGLIPHAVMNV